MTRARLLARVWKDNRGFTLIEMIVVVIILGLLAGLVGPRLFGRVGQSKMVAARAQIELLGAALDQYSLDVGTYPPSSVGLEALVRNPNIAAWNGPYLKKNAIPARSLGQSLSVQVLSRGPRRVRSLERRRGRQARRRGGERRHRFVDAQVSRPLGQVASETRRERSGSPRRT